MSWNSKKRALLERFSPVDGNPWRTPETVRDIDSADTEEIEDLLLGKRVAKADDEHLILDDGTTLRLIGNVGCGGCTSGWYELAHLGEVDNVITRVEFPTKRDSDLVDGEWVPGYYTIFVFAGDAWINLATFEGDDGSGYYGTGYEIRVRKP